MLLTLTKAKCCKTWTVALEYQIRSCGVCGRVPTIDSDQLFEQIDISLEPLDERVQDDRS